MWGLRATTSPISPAGSSVVSSHDAMASSATSTIRTSTPGSGVPTQTPAPSSVAFHVSPRTVSPEISATGSASVAP